jgi:hypothetical protein
VITVHRAAVPAIELFRDVSRTCTGTKHSTASWRVLWTRTHRFSTAWKRGLSNCRIRS